MTAGVRPRLLAVWLFLIALVAAVFVADFTRIFDSEPEPRSGTVAMFAFSEPEIGAVEALYRGRFSTLMRDEEGRWFVHDSGHLHSAAGDAAATADEVHAVDPERSEGIRETLALTARLVADRFVEPEQTMDHYGLDKPETMIVLFGRDGEGGPDYGRRLDTLHIGDLLADQYTYYVLREGDPRLFLVPRFYIALLLGELYGADQVPTPLPARPDDPAG